MPRRATGQVLRRPSVDGGTIYALRFTANGERQYVTLGNSKDGWTLAKAQEQLEHELARVRTGAWTPPDAETAPAMEEDPTFHDFASRWFDAGRDEWQEKTRLDYEWQLSSHLLPFFKAHRLSQITIAEVDRYRTAKASESARLAKAQGEWRSRVERAKDRAERRKLIRERPPKPLSVTSINKTITRLGQILETAVEYGVLDRNPARGRKRRLKPSRPAPVWLDSAEQIEALLNAAAEMDRGAKSNGQLPRRAILATLTLAGLRIGEMIDLRWRDVNLADGWLQTGSKTDAGNRRIDLLPALRIELAALKAANGGGKVLDLAEHRARRRDGAPALSDERVFPTQAGGPMNPSNVRTRILAPAVRLASERLEANGSTPLPAGVTPHKLRHTFASLLVALGTDPGAVMDQLGHTDAEFTMRVYRHGMRRDPGSKAALAALVGAGEQAPAARAARR